MMHRASDNGVISGMYSMVLTDARQDLICDKGPPARSAYRWTHANDLETIMSRANRFTVSLLIGVAIAVMIGLADAQPRQPARGPAVESGGMIYGSQLMTPAERTEYRTRMLAAASDVEREKIRAEHHAEMQKRAKARGIKLPDAPPPCAACIAGKEWGWAWAPATCMAGPADLRAALLGSDRAVRRIRPQARRTYLPTAILVCTAQCGDVGPSSQSCV